MHSLGTFWHTTQANQDGAGIHFIKDNLIGQLLFFKEADEGGNEATALLTQSKTDSN